MKKTTNKRKTLLYPTEARSRALFRQCFSHVKQCMLEYIDEILADPAKACALMPPNHNYATHEEVRLGAYLSWWRDNGHEPDGRNHEEWAEFLVYNDAFPRIDSPMGIRAVLEEFEPFRRLTLERFAELAGREPSLVGQWVYRLEHIRTIDGIHYPEFETYTETYMFLTHGQAQTFLRQMLPHGEDSYCFLITQLPIGELQDKEGAKWLYDGKGNLLDFSVTTYEADPLKSKFFGRPPSRIRFKKGDIVEVILRNRVRLAVVGADFLPISWFWERYCNLPAYAEYFPDASDDSYYLIDGPEPGSHTHAHALSLMKHSRPIPEEIKNFFAHCQNECDDKNFK